MGAILASIMPHINNIVFRKRLEQKQDSVKSAFPTALAVATCPRTALCEQPTEHHSGQRQGSTDGRRVARTRANDHSVKPYTATDTKIQNMAFGRGVKLRLDHCPSQWMRPWSSGSEWALDTVVVHIATRIARGHCKYSIVDANRQSRHGWNS